MMAPTGALLGSPALLASLALFAAACGCNSGSPGGASTTPTSTTTASLGTTTTTDDTTTSSAAAEDGPCKALATLTFASLSPDGSRLLAMCWGDDCKSDPPATSIDVWDLTKGTLERVLNAQSADVRAEWVSPDLIVAQSGFGTGVKEIDIWDAHTFESLHAGSHYGAGFDVDPSGRRVLITGIDGMMTLFDAKTKKLTSRPEKEAHLGGDYSVGSTFSPDGKRIFVDDEYGGLEVLDTATLRRTSRFATLDEAGQNRTFTARSPSLKQIVALPPNGSLFSLRDNLSRGAEIAPKGTFAGAKGVRFLDETRLLIGGEDGKRILFDLATKKPLRTYDWPSGDNLPCGLDIDISAKGAYLTYQHGDCATEILDGKTLTPLWTLPAEVVPPAKTPEHPSLVWGRDDGILVAIYGERLIVFRDAKTGAERSRVRLPDGKSQVSNNGSYYYPLQVRWTPDERHLLVAQGEVFFVRPEDGRTAALDVMETEGARVAVITTDTEIEGPIEMDACARRPMRKGAAEGARTPAKGLLRAFLDAK